MEKSMRTRGFGMKTIIASGPRSLCILFLSHNLGNRAKHLLPQLTSTSSSKRKLLKHFVTMTKSSENKSNAGHDATPTDGTDPLRDTTTLVDAATKQALKLKEEYAKTKQKKNVAKTMTAMEFCLCVLEEGLGLPDFGVGQRQRIVISKTRKEVLGKELDSKIIHAPTKGKTMDCEMVPTREVYEQLSKEISEDQQIADDASSEQLESAFDADSLKENGILHMPKVVSSQEVLDILKELSDLEVDNKKNIFRWTYLRPTTGNGEYGAYAKFPPRKVPKLVQQIQKQLQHLLETKMDVESGNKAIYLKYGPGGVNWAHQDQSTHPYQAMLLLSRPNIDFRGGKLYVCDPSPSLGVMKKEIEWKSHGDLVIFSANDNNATGRPFYHGMTKIEGIGAGDENINKTETGDGACHRLAIGMLQT